MVQFPAGHYPLFDQMFASSSNQEGGHITVATEDHMTKVLFHTLVTTNTASAPTLTCG
jgi:hypothetical protein